MGDLLHGIVLGLHLATAHSAPGFETATPGIYLRAESGFTAGAYRNSNGRGSAYLAWTWETGDFLGQRRFALTVGAVTGYEAQPVMPLLVPSVRIGLGEQLSMRLAFIPKPPARGSAYGLSLSLEQEF
jgi:hypothetical protein